MVGVQRGWTYRTGGLQASQATPMVYEVVGRKYLFIMAEGHHFMPTLVGDYVIALALPEVGIQREPLPHLLDYLVHFFRPLGIEIFLIGGKLVQQSQKLSNVNKFFVRYILEHFDGKLVVGGLGELCVQLGRFVLCGDQETNGSDELLVAEFSVICQT